MKQVSLCIAMRYSFDWQWSYTIKCERRKRKRGGLPSCKIDYVDPWRFDKTSNVSKTFSSFFTTVCHEQLHVTYVHTFYLWCSNQCSIIMLVWSSTNSFQITVFSRAFYPPRNEHVSDICLRIRIRFNILRLVFILFFYFLFSSHNRWNSGICKVHV
jgi:hypothetical protein